MNSAASSRQRILESIRSSAAFPKGNPDQLAQARSALPRAYIRSGSLSPELLVKLLIERLREYEAQVTECVPAELSSAIAGLLAASGRRTFVAPPALAPEWLAPGFDWKVDRGLSVQEIENAEGVVTAAACAVADSGTIVLHHGPTEGRRVLTLLPDWHLCILRADQVVETFPEYFDLFPAQPALVTWISGPSATADIEMTRIKGVHGPRTLHVILVRSS